MTRRARGNAAAKVSPTKKVLATLGTPSFGAERRGFGQDAAQTAVFIDHAGNSSPLARACTPGFASEGRQGPQT